MGNIIDLERYSRKRVMGFMSEIAKEKMLEIEKITNGILAGIDFEKSPYVDIVSLVKKENFEVEPTEMDIETTGCLLVNNNEKRPKRLIMVNTYFKNPDNEPDVIFKKSRFITAHEYGHFKLHSIEGQPIYAHRDTYHRTDQNELEADYFARSILMPLRQFKVYYNTLNRMANNDETFAIEILSSLFGVTKNKIRKRIGDLLALDQ